MLNVEARISRHEKAEGHGAVRIEVRANCSCSRTYQGYLTFGARLPGRLGQSTLSRGETILIDQSISSRKCARS